MENNEEFREGTENGYDYLLHSPDYCSFGIFNHYFVINISARLYGMINTKTKVIIFIRIH